jgi:integrase
MRGSISKRGNSSWRLVFDLERDHTGKRRQTSFTVRGTKKQAEAALSRRLAEVESGGFVEPGKIKLSEYLSRWLKHVETKTSAKTHERYSEIVQLAIIPALGSIKLGKLSPMQIQTFYGEALKSGRIKGEGGLSARTVLHYHRILFQALRQAVRWRLLSNNPADAVEPPKAVQKEMMALNEDQTAILIESVKNHALYIPVLLAVTTGLRRGEILGLRWCDVDLERAKLSVTQTLIRTDKGGIHFKQPKRKMSRRSVSLPSMLVDVLRKHRAERAEQLLSFGVGWNEQGLICSRPAGEPIHPGTLTSKFSHFVKTQDIPKVRFHDLRHTHATQLFKDGIHPKVVQERLGHSTIAVTLDLYSHVLPGMQEDAASRVDTALRAALGRLDKTDT